MDHPIETKHQSQSMEAPQEDFEREPGLVDGLKFLYIRRLKLAVYFLAVFGISALLYLASYFSSPKIVQGSIGLAFRGIEKHEYPSGRKFSVEDFRSPEILERALKASGVSKEVLSPRELGADVLISPVIPSEIQARWKVQEKVGSKKDEYYPNEFLVSLDIGALANAHKMRLFYAVVEAYQQRVKSEQASSLSYIASWNASYDELAKTYDVWDIPMLFRDAYRALALQVRALLTESAQAQDPKYQLAFREIARGLSTWETTRLQALEAITYQGRLVKNRDLTMQRIQYRIQEFDIQIRQKTEETSEAVHLLETIDRPRALLAGSLSNRDGQPMVDATALDRLVKSDYIGPVVQRISRLQEETKALEADKTRLQKQLTELPKSANIDLNQLPAGYRELLALLSSELKSVIVKYNSEVDDYLTATVTSLVTVRQSPIITRAGYSLVLMLPAIFCLSLFIAVVLMAIENVLKKAKELAKQERSS